MSPEVNVGRQMRYGYRRSVDAPLAAVVERVRAALQHEGFGVLFEIDLKTKLREKLGVEFRNYLILGACDPATAHQALQQEIDLGLLLPCNVAVYEEDDGRITVGAVDAARLLEITGNTGLAESAASVNLRLHRAIDQF